MKARFQKCNCTSCTDKHGEIRVIEENGESHIYTISSEKSGKSFLDYLLSEKKINENKFEKVLNDIKEYFTQGP
jgi:Mn-containing catalase